MKYARYGWLPGYGFTFDFIFGLVFLFSFYLFDAVAFLSFNGECTEFYYVIYEEQLAFWEFFGILILCLGYMLLTNVGGAYKSKKKNWVC